MAYKPKRSGTKKSAPNARARRVASRAANGVNTSRTRAEREPLEQVEVRVGTRAIRQEEVAEAIAPVIAEFSLVLEDLKLSGPATSRTVKVTVDYTADRTDSLSLDSLAEISSAISAALDRADANDEFFPYELQVSSPGATRALTERRHWERARTRLVAVTAPEGTEYLARLLEVQDEGPVLARKKNTKKGQKESYHDPALVEWENIASAHVEIDFNSPADPVE